MTAKEIFLTGLKSGMIGKIVSEKGSIANYEIIIEALNPDEEILMSFNGILNRKGLMKNDGIFSYVVTNKRLIWSRKMPFLKDLDYLVWDNVEHVSFAKLASLGDITIETIAKPYVVSMELYAAEAVYSKLSNLILELKSSQKQPVMQTTDAADEIAKYKNLLDMGAITQEEYDLKKKQLLGL